MSVDAVRALCLSLPGSTEDIKWEDNLVFSVGGRMFAMVDLEPPYRLSFKCSPDDYAELVERDGIGPAPYLARAQWVSVESVDDVLETQEMATYLRRAHEAIVARLPKRQREALSSAPSSPSRARVARTRRR